MTTLFDLPFEDPEPVNEEAHAPAGEASTRRRVLRVAELNASVRALVEDQFVDLWVDGEISNFRPWRTGHLYFTLKDDQAQIRAVMFRSAVRYLKFAPEDGLRVVVRGRLTVYEPKGEYQIVCEHMEPCGLGALQLAFDQRRQQLQREGLFDAARKRPLPLLPRKIGVVTSMQGAALHDIIQILRRRYANVHLVIRPARVQGEGAAEDITRGLQAIGRVPGVDVVIVGRGGGSIEDLWAFNEESVARAIAASPVPVIAAVGHESDVTIADFVADLRAATPSAAAELVVARKDEFGGRIDQLRERAAAAVRARIQRRRTAVHGLATRPALAGFPAHVAVRGRHVAELTHDLRHAMRAKASGRARHHHDLQRRLERCHPGRRFATLRGRFNQANGALVAAMLATRQRCDAQLRTLAARLENLSPLAVLGRGYAVCWDESRAAIIRDADTVVSGATVRVTLARGELTCSVTDRTARSSGDAP